MPKPPVTKKTVRHPYAAEIHSNKPVNKGVPMYCPIT